MLEKIQQQFFFIGGNHCHSYSESLWILLVEQIEHYDV